MTDRPDLKISDMHTDASARMLSDTTAGKKDSYLASALGAVSDPIFGHNSTASNGIKFWGSEFAKTASFFLPGKAGYAASMVFGAADQAKVGDTLGNNIVDASLGAVKGGLTKAAFSVVGGNETFGTGLWTIPAKGMVLGTSSRFLDTTLTRQNWQDGSGNFDLGKGAATAFDATFNGKALLMDAALFGVAEGSAMGVNRLTGGLLDRSPMARNMVMGSSFGASSGALNELEAQRSSGKPLDFAAIAEHSLMSAAVDGLAAAPGGFMSDPVARRAVSDKFDGSARKATAMAAFGSAALTGDVQTHQVQQRSVENQLNPESTVSQITNPSRIPSGISLDQIRINPDTTITYGVAPLENASKTGTATPPDIATRTGANMPEDGTTRTPAEVSAEATAATLRDLGVSVDSLQRPQDASITRTGAVDPTVGIDGGRVVETYERTNAGAVQTQTGDRIKLIDSLASVTGGGTVEIFGSSQVRVNVPEGQTMRLVVKDGAPNLTIGPESKGTVELVNQTNNPELSQRLQNDGQGKPRPDVKVLDSLTEVLTPEEVANVQRFRADEAALRQSYVPLTAEVKQRMADEAYGDGAAVKGRVFHIVIGPPGSGKTSYLVEPLAKRFGAMVLDSDGIKPKIPGYENGLGTNVVHADSAEITKMVMAKGAANGDNMIEAQLGRVPEDLVKRIQTIQAAGYKVAVHLADLPPEQATRRVYDRSQQPPNAEGIRQMVDPNFALTVTGRNPLIAFNHVLSSVPDLAEWSHIDTNVPRGTRPILVRQSINRIERPLAGPDLSDLFARLPFQSPDGAYGVHNAPVIQMRQRGPASEPTDTKPGN